MKALLILILLAIPCVAQTPELDWKLIKEMSGEIPDHPGMRVETYAREIARAGDNIKVLFRFRFPDGSPEDIFRSNVPRGVDPTSIAIIEGRLEIDCAKLLIKPVKEEAIVYLFTGKRFKSKEPPFIDTQIFTFYFCERDSVVPIQPPTLKSRP